MGDRIAVLKDGVLQQVGTPRELYAKPKNVFVAGFIGSPSMNIFGADLTSEGVRFGTDIIPLERATLAKLKTGTATVGVRPDDIIISREEKPGLKVEVDLVEELGAEGYLYGHSIIDGKRTDIVARVDGRSHPEVGETIYVTTDNDHIHIFDPETEQRISGALTEAIRLQEANDALASGAAS